MKRSVMEKYLDVIRDTGAGIEIEVFGPGHEDVRIFCTNGAVWLIPVNHYIPLAPRRIRGPDGEVAE